MQNKSNNKQITSEIIVERIKNYFIEAKNRNYADFIIDSDLNNIIKEFENSIRENAVVEIQADILYNLSEIKSLVNDVTDSVKGMIRGYKNS